MSTTTSDTSMREPDQLERLRPPLGLEHIELMEDRIFEHQGELCLCIISHNYSTRDLHVHKFMGNYNDSDYTTNHHADRYLLAWRAGAAPEAGHDGDLVIPTDEHILITSDNWGWFVYSGPRHSSFHYRLPNAMEVVAGDVQHGFLKNKRFGLAIDFDLPGAPTPEEATQDDYINLDNEDEAAYYPLMGGKPGTWLTFLIGDTAAFGWLEASKWDHQRLLEFVKAVTGLGCALSPNFQAMVNEAGKELRLKLQKQAVELLAKNDGNGLRDLGQLYRRTFGEPLETIDLTALTQST